MTTLDLRPAHSSVFTHCLEVIVVRVVTFILSFKESPQLIKSDAALGLMEILLRLPTFPNFPESFRLRTC